MTGELTDRPDTRSVTSLAALSFAMWGGLVAWIVHLNLALGMVGAACHDTGIEWAIHLLTVVTALVAAAATLVGVRAWRAGDDADRNAWHVSGRESFMGMVGALLSAIGLMLIVFEGLPVFFVDPCLS